MRIFQLKFLCCLEELISSGGYKGVLLPCQEKGKKKKKDQDNVIA